MHKKGQDLMGLRKETVTDGQACRRVRDRGEGWH